MSTAIVRDLAIVLACVAYVVVTIRNMILDYRDDLRLRTDEEELQELKRRMWDVMDALERKFSSLATEDDDDGGGWS